MNVVLISMVIAILWPWLIAFNGGLSLLSKLEFFFGGPKVELLKRDLVITALPLV